jgi:hypothetical protein
MFCLGAFLLTLSGCSQQEEKLPAIVVQEPVPGAGPSTGALYPFGFPIPQYPGSGLTTTSSSALASGGKEARAIVLASQDDIFQIAKFYQEKLIEGNWKITQMTTSGSLLSIEAQREKSKVNISITKVGANYSVAGKKGIGSSIQLVLISL